MELRCFSFQAMGAPCQLQLYAESSNRGEASSCGEATVQAIAEAARADVHRLEAKYSRFLPDSVTSRINASAGDERGVEVDAETGALLDYADMGHRQSGGLFDVTSGVLRRVWDWKSGRLPAEDDVRQMLHMVGWEKVGWQRPRVCLPIPGMQIDLGGYVKEYAADRVAQLCRDMGLRHGLVDLGGDLAVVGPLPDGSPWRVGIRHPRQPRTAIAMVELACGAIATSGDYERFMLIDGVRYCHILDPRTGWPVHGLAGVSVIAEHCVVAGTASTIAMLEGRVRGRAWLEELGLPHLCVDADLRVHGSLASPSLPRQQAAASIAG